MKNFIFKSSKNFDLHKISVLLKLSLTEQRHQREDLQKIKRSLNLLVLDLKHEPTAEELGFSDTEHGE